MRLALNPLFFLSLLSVFLRPIGASTFTLPPSTSAGVVEKQIEKEYEAKPIEPWKGSVLEVDIPEEPLDLREGISVRIDSVEFVGNTVFSKKELQKLAKPYIEKKNTFKDVKLLCLAVQEHYVKKGYFLTRVFPPVQQLLNGQLIIRIVEASLGQVRVVGNKHYSAKFIAAYFSHLKGKPIQYDNFIRAVMLANDNNDLTVGVVFEKGKVAGTADLIVKVYDKRPIHGYVDYNTYGSHANTYQRTGLRIDYGNLLFNGDNLTAIEVLGLPFSHLQFTDFIYSCPVNHRGTSVSLSYIYSDFKVNRSSSLNPSGRSTIAAFKVQQALMRSRNIKADIYVEFDYKRIRNLFNHNSFSIDNLRVLLSNFYLDAFDSCKGRNIANARVSVGLPDFLASSNAVSSHSSRPGAGGRFVYLNADYKRIQELPNTQYLVFSTAGQYSFNKLPLSEQFYIGGIDTVRGFPLATAVGEQGYYANLEYRFPLPVVGDYKLPYSHSGRKIKDLFQFIGFVDNGTIWVKQNDPFDEHAPVFLLSSGLGFRINNFFRFSFNFDVGFPLTKAHRSSSSILYYKVSYKLF